MLFEKLRDFPKYRTLVIATLISFIPFLFLTLIFIINELRLMEISGYGVLDFELAWTPDKINTIFSAWGSGEILQQTMITYIDYLFIPCYVLFGIECILLAARQLKGKYQEFGVILLIAFLLAGIFDAIENIFLLLISTNSSSFWISSPLFASLFASLKIGALGTGLGTIYILMMKWISIKYNFPSPYFSIILIAGGVFIFWLFWLWTPSISIIIGLAYLFLLFSFFLYVGSRKDGEYK